jgi:hypothetical protein
MLGERQKSERTVNAVEGHPEDRGSPLAVLRCLRPLQDCRFCWLGAPIR